MLQHGHQIYLRADIHKETLMYFFVTCAGSLMPLIAGLLLIPLLSEWIGWQIFWEKGEFYLYGASFFTSSMYVLYANKKSNFDLLSITFWISLVSLVLSCLMYGGLLAYLVLPTGPGEVSPDFLAQTSILALGISLVLYYFSAYVDNLKRATNVLDEETRTVTSLVRGLK